MSWLTFDIFGARTGRRSRSFDCPVARNRQRIRRHGCAQHTGTPGSTHSKRPSRLARGGTDSSPLKSFNDWATSSTARFLPGALHDISPRRASRCRRPPACRNRHLWRSVVSASLSACRKLEYEWLSAPSPGEVQRKILDRYSLLVSLRLVDRCHGRDGIHPSYRFTALPARTR